MRAYNDPSLLTLRATYHLRKGAVAMMSSSLQIASDGLINRFALAAIFLSIFAAPVAAEYPNKPIRLIVPQAVGSATDTVARILGAQLATELGQRVVVDNRPGGALTIGLDATARSEPDGYTISIASIGALAMNRHMVAKLPYDIEHDFQ